MDDKLMGITHTVQCTMYIHAYIHVHVYMHMYMLYMYVHVHERSVIETRQSKATTPEDNSSFPEKEELPQAGFEPTTFCVLGRRSTN